MDYYTTPERSPGPPDDDGYSDWVREIQDLFSEDTGEDMEDVLTRFDYESCVGGSPAGVAEMAVEQWQAKREKRDDWERAVDLEVMRLTEYKGGLYSLNIEYLDEYYELGDTPEKTARMLLEEG